MKRRSFLERAAQWVAAGTAALVVKPPLTENVSGVKEAPAAPVAAAKPAPSFMPSSMIKPHLEAHHRSTGVDPGLKEGDLVYLDSNGTVSPALPRDYYDEDLYGIYQRFARELGRTAQYTQERDALSIFGG